MSTTSSCPKVVWRQESIQKANSSGTESKMKVVSSLSIGPEYRKVTEIGYDDIQAFEGVGLFRPKLLRNKSPAQHVFKNFIFSYENAHGEGYVKMKEGIITGLYLTGIIIDDIESIGQLYHLFDRFNNPDEVDMRQRSDGSYSIRIWFD